jgi:imidazolonepropionase-like amidohydrolase
MAEEHLPTLLPESYVIKSTRLLRKGTWQPGRFLMRNGKIVALAPDKKLPISIPVYDLGAAPVTSGLLVAHGSLSATASIDDRSEADASNIQAADAYDPSDPRVTKLLEAGFLRVAFSPGSTNVVAGAVCQVRIGAANPVRGNVVAMKFVLSAKARDAARYPGSLAGQVELMREVLQAKGVRSRLFAPVAIEQALLDERKQRIKSVLRKRTTALFEANSSAEIRAAIRLVERFEIRGVLVSPDDVSPFIDDLKRLDIGVVARPVRTGDYDRYVDGLAKASTAGVHIAFGSTADEDGRMTAALAVSAGMSREAALSGLTAGGAKLLGMPSNSCALVVGAPGDFVVWNGSPLDLRCRPTNVVVDGKIAFATTAPGDSESNQPEAASLGQVNSEGP